MNEFVKSLLVIRTVEMLTCAVVLISSIEMLTHPQSISDAGLSSWPVSQLANKWTAGARFRKLLDWLLNYPGVLGLFFFRLLCGIGLLLLGANHAAAHAFLGMALFLTSLLLTVRSPFGHDGADQMSNLTILAVALAYAISSLLAIKMALWFIALQACLSYFTAGVAKLRSPVWRSGTGLEGIFKTEIYGHHLANKMMMKYKGVPQAASWTVITFECLFPLSLAGIAFLTTALVCMGTAFHLLNALFMRLNTFFWAFLATYPAILYCSQVYDCTPPF